MAIRFYDEALYNKIQKWVKDPKIQILRPDETARLFQITADKNKDKPIRLPLIALSRDRNIEILNTNKNVKSFDGFNIKSNEETSMLLNVIPIQLNYQIDIYTKSMEEADEYVRNFVFNFVNLPKLKVNIPYQDMNLEHISNIFIESEIVDNSDIAERLFPDQFVRFTLRLVIDDAYLFSLPYRDNAYIESVDVVFKDRNTDEIFEKEQAYLKIDE